MLGPVRSLLMALLLSAIALGTPTLAGTESWSTFFRDLLSLPDYEAIIEEESQLSKILDKKDKVILARLNAKNLIIDQLAARKISFLEATACFLFLKNENDEILEIIDPFMREQPPEVSCALNLIQWAKPDSRLPNDMQEEFAQFQIMVNKIATENKDLVLPLPPAKILANIIF